MIAAAGTRAGAAGRLAGHGLGVRLPDRWEGRVYRRGVASTPVAAASGPSLPSAAGWLGERPHPVLHLANFALPAQRGDYGSGAVEAMSARHVFVALLEFGPDCLGTALYAADGLPVLSAADFDPNALQRRLPGQSGCQRFCTVNGRPFCLYVVLGSHRLAPDLAAEADAVVRRIEVAA